MVKKITVNNRMNNRTNRYAKFLYNESPMYLPDDSTMKASITTPLKNANATRCAAYKIEKSPNSLKSRTLAK